MAEWYKTSTCWLLKSPRNSYPCNGLLNSSLSVISYKFYLKYINFVFDFVSQLDNAVFTYRAEAIRKIYMDRLNLNVILLIVDSELFKMDTPVKLNSSVVAIN